MKIRRAVWITFLTIAMMMTQVSVMAGENADGADGPGNLYALSAVLMDGETGRVLYEKEGETARPMASTTKVMTCILALENAAGDDYVTVTKNAAAQPDVKLHMQVGEQYYMEDLLYSLMLKSHNDTAVAIAEHVGGSVEGFAGMMNEKAKEIGCTDTYFITPNGLDAKDGAGEHHTTARDLALIMRYAMKNQTFLHITQTRDYTFSDLSKKRQFSIHNSNALLDMTDGVLSGKTGFTGNAGYCYVCACQKNGKTLIVSLLGCGWPGNKTYKWKDTMKLLKYGDETYHYQNVRIDPELKKVLVEDGVQDSMSLNETLYLDPVCGIPEEEKSRRLLLKDTDQILCRVKLPEQVSAPVKKGQKIGQITYTLNGEPLYTYPILAPSSIPCRTFTWCVNRIFHSYFH